MNRRRAAIASIASIASIAGLATVGLLGTATYLGRPQEHDPQAVQWLQQHPGGTLTGLAEITYVRDGVSVMVVTFRPVTDARPDCPVGTLCLYATADYGYPRAAIEVCGHVNLRSMGWGRRAQSIQNNLPSEDHAGGVELLRSDGDAANPAAQQRVLTLAPAARTTVNAPGIDYLYHFC